tara:strand:+ start:252 stop:482 length:231 start_codon:yes stop_codon:yes gene_type:complete
MNNDVTPDWLSSVGLDREISLGGHMSIQFYSSCSPDLNSTNSDTYYGWEDSIDLNNVKTREDILTLCRLLGIKTNE